MPDPDTGYIANGVHKSLHLYHSLHIRLKYLFRDLKDTQFLLSFSIKMAATTTFFDAIVNRRTYYQLTNTSPIPQSRISELVHEALKYSPSPCEHLSPGSSFSHKSNTDSQRPQLPLHHPLRRRTHRIMGQCDRNDAESSPRAIPRAACTQDTVVQGGVWNCKIAFFARTSKRTKPESTARC